MKEESKPETKKTARAIGDTAKDKETVKPQPTETFARAANEDDDGYDPWSDRIVQEPFWEKDPWS